MGRAGDAGCEGERAVEVNITVTYSCGLCGLLNVPALVPAREEEDVVVWFEATLIPTLSADHRHRSPTCHPDSLQSITIPLTGTERVGGPVVS